MAFLASIATSIALLLVAAAPAPAGDPPAAGGAVTSLWTDAPADGSRVRVDQIPDIPEPSDLLIHKGALYTVSDSRKSLYRLDLDKTPGRVVVGGTWQISGLPAATDLEALAELPGGEVLLASETRGNIFVLSSFPDQACAAWETGVSGTCLFGRANCGVEAIAVLPGGKLLVAKEREPRAAYLFDIPQAACTAATLGGRTRLELPDEVGPDISAATYDPVSGHLLLVARARQKVLELALSESKEGERSLHRLELVGSFSFRQTEDSLEYGGLGHHQVEGIAVDEKRVLHLVVDNNERASRVFGNRRAALLRFFPPPN